MPQSGPETVTQPGETAVDAETPQTAMDAETEVGAEAPDTAEDAEALLEADLLVEDVSIDGMCGVY